MSGTNQVQVSTDDFFPSVVLSAADASGNARQLFGVPVWASSDETILTVAAAADGMSAVVQTVAPGTARISVTAEADPTPGVNTLTGVSNDVVVSLGRSSEASVLTLNLGTPQPKTPVPAPTP